MPKTPEARRESWRELVEQQQQSGLSVRAFRQQRRRSEHSFYRWRKRLTGQLPIKFALIDTARVQPEALEVILTSGERLRVRPGVDADTLRLVLSALREAQ
jgi:hypothetical protein